MRNSHRLTNGYRPRSCPPRKSLLTALVADQTGKIFELQGYAAVGMDGSELTPLSLDATRKIPYGSELMFLPDRIPLLYNLESGRMEVVPEDPFSAGQAIYPVAAFNSPGHVISHVTGYRERRGAGYLPLFSYGAVGWHRSGFRSAVILVDAERRQDLRLMKMEDVAAGIEHLRRVMPDNRLRAHLETCAQQYGCPAAKNFFLGRYEAPLPTAVRCNARCRGCLSLQTEGHIQPSQERIRFTPSPAEVAAVALVHIDRVQKSVVSFGQGCEGDPLLAADVIEPALHMIRAKTDRGTLNMNTNGSRPDQLRRLLDAGLDSVRISLNSVRRECYEAYFRPQGYGFGDVLKSIDLARGNGKFVAINYLNCPGLTDTPEEFQALIDFLHRHSIHMIQWRNLNYDPLRYWKLMNQIACHDSPVGMENLLNSVRREFPHLRHGYFNPPKQTFPGRDEPCRGAGRADDPVSKPVVER
jgi:pyruvate-formate lyase-activating enzyme